MSESEPSAFRDALAALAPIPEEEWNHLAAGVVRLAVPRGAPLIRQGERVDWLGYLARGLVRIHHLVRERDVTLGFDCEGRFVGAYDAYLQRTPARFGLETLEPSVVLRLERPLLDELEQRHPCWRELGRRIVERELLRKIDKELRIRTRTPEERYADLLRSGSYLVRRVPQYHLASFLGIAPETLSRIRARMDGGPPRASPARS